MHWLGCMIESGEEVDEYNQLLTNYIVKVAVHLVRDIVAIHNAATENLFMARA